MASLLNRKGIYYAQFYDANREPKAKRHSLQTQKKSEARKRLVDLERDWHAGIFDPWHDDPRSYKKGSKPAKSLSLADALAAFVTVKQKEGRAKGTVENYRSYCGILVRHIGGQKPLRRLTSDAIESYVLDKNIAQATRGTRYRHVRAWLRWCAKQGFIKRTVMESVTSPSAAEKMPKVVREADLGAIETALYSDYHAKLERGEVKTGELIWMIPLFRFAFYSGLRASELARLQWGHIDFERNLIRIYRQKNGKQQTVPLTAPARTILLQLPEGAAGDFVFLAPGSDPRRRNIKSFRCNVARKFKRYRLAAGIERPITPHGLRHGFCTMLAEAGKSAIVIKEAARHADIQTSMRYVHLSNEHLKAELDDVFL